VTTPNPKMVGRIAVDDELKSRHAEFLVDGVIGMTGLSASKVHNIEHDTVTILNPKMEESFVKEYTIRSKHV